MSQLTTIKILSFDPGTTITGWVYSTYNKHTHLLTVNKCGEITPIKNAKKLNKEDCTKYSPQLIALDHLYNEVYELLRKYQPNVVVSEDAFLHPKFILAYAALNLCIHTISRAARVHGLVCERIAPKLVKKLMSENGTSGKTDMLKAIVDNDNVRIIGNKCNKEVTMSEHVSDAIAVGYAYTRQMTI